ncbi:CapA family protein [Geotalea uraniireducens]|nr:CapA family protein [Geotalea uraniireducens]
MKLLFAGDVMLGRLVNRALQRLPPEYPWGDTLPLFATADWRMCNLECVISDNGTPWSLTPKIFHFRSDAGNVAVLQAAHIDAVSLANNHSLDYEYEAMFDMLRILNKAKIAHAGAGADLAEASRPAVSQVQGLRIGVIAFTDNEPAWEAATEQAGVWFVPIDLQNARAAGLMAKIHRVRAEVDLLVVSVHWGPNWGHEPPPEHIDFGRALIDAGADAVFGHSGHVFRGIEIYRQRPIIYCAGDFIDDYAVDEVERNDRSMIFILEYDQCSLSKIRLYPTVIRDFQARLAQGSEAEWIGRKMQQLCADLATSSLWLRDEQCLEIVPT